MLKVSRRIQMESNKNGPNKEADIMNLCLSIIIKYEQNETRILHIFWCQFQNCFSFVLYICLFQHLFFEKVKVSQSNKKSFRFIEISVVQGNDLALV